MTTKFLPLIDDLQNSYSTVKFINLSMSAFGILGTSSKSFPSMLTNLNVNGTTKHNILQLILQYHVLITSFVEKTNLGLTQIYWTIRL